MLDNIWSWVVPKLKAYPQQVAWICRQSRGKRVVDYQTLEQAALTTASILRQRGLGRGDTVSITAPNGPEWCVAALAAWKLGACIAPIHIGNSAHDIAQQVRALQPKVMLRYAAPTASENSLTISLQVEPARVAQEAQVETPWAAAEVAVRVYTSGSTGTPKVVRLSHSNVVSNVLAIGNIQRFDTRDRFIALLPFSHAMGLVGNFLLPMSSGATMVAPRLLAANEVLAALQEEGISVIIAVPRLYRNIMWGLEQKFQQGGRALALYRAGLKALPIGLRQVFNAPIRRKLGGRIKTWVSGGSHLDGRITRYYHDLGLPLRQGYGLTETSPLTCLQAAFDTAIDSVGKPIEQVHLKLHQPDTNGHGEVWIKGPNVMLGYEDATQNTAALQDGWFKSGDIGRLDAQGRLYLTGRAKRLLVTEAGKNVYPEELETLLERESIVKEAAVIEKDRKPAALLCLQSDAVDAKPGNRLDENRATARAILKRFNALVSSHNRITRFALVDELPKTALGKVALQQLAQLFAQNEEGL